MNIKTASPCCFIFTDIDRLQIINDHVLTNIKHLKAMSRHFYKSSYLSDDLFQEFYLKITEVPEEKFQRYRLNLMALSYYIMFTLYARRNRNNSSLGLPNIMSLSDGEYNCVDLYRNGYTETPDYLQDVVDYMEKEKTKEHGFADMLVFTEAMDKTLRELSKETGISTTALCHYRQAGQAKLQKLLA